MNPRKLSVLLNRKKYKLARRLWRYVVVCKSSRGLSAARLGKQIGVSRATVYRDLHTLRTLGVDLQKQTVNGEVWYTVHQGLPDVAFLFVIAVLRVHGLEFVDHLVASKFPSKPTHRVRF